MTQPPLPNNLLAQILNQTGGQIPQPGQQLNLNTLWCDCCGEARSTLPHSMPDPSGGSLDYCQKCYDAGCQPDNWCDLGDDDLGDCVVCKRTQVQLAYVGGEHPWCGDCYEKYEAYLETHPIPPKDRFTPVFRGEQQPLAHMPAYMYPPDQWDQANFKPEYILDPATAPRPTKKKAFIVTQQQPQPSGLTEDDVRRMIAEAQAGPDQLANMIPGGNVTTFTIDDMLESIDPRDSDTALKLFNWLRDNARLHKVATLDQGGYLFLYQEPEGASKQGYTAGGTQGDRIVDDALEKAQAAGQRALKGLCPKCYSPVLKVGDGPIEAETPRPGTSATECPADGGPHDFAG